jgi:hypothetical protein
MARAVSHQRATRLAGCRLKYIQATVKLYSASPMLLRESGAELGPPLTATIPRKVKTRLTRASTS